VEIADCPRRLACRSPARRLSTSPHQTRVADGHRTGISIVRSFRVTSPELRSTNAIKTGASMVLLLPLIVRSAPCGRTMGLIGLVQPR